MLDDELVIYEYLNAASPLKTAIGSNLFTNTAHDFKGDESKGIRFRIKGGSSHPNAPMESPLVDFFCYGGSGNEEDSRAIYRLLRDRLQGKTNEETTSGFLVSSVQVVIGQIIKEPDTNWWATFTTYQITLREKE